jgi:hypothetical protein
VAVRCLPEASASKETASERLLRVEEIVVSLRAQAPSASTCGRYIELLRSPVTSG